MLIALTSQEQETVCELYRNGWSRADLASRFGVCPGTIYNYLKRHSVPLAPPGGYHGYRIHSIDEHAFDTMDEDAAYWIGILMADGCVTRHRGQVQGIQLTLHIQDIDHLRAFRDFLGSTAPIITPSTSNCGRLSIYSRKLASSVERFGLVPNKSHTAQVRLFEHNRHFWRGVVDGDGSICFGQTRPSGPYPILSLCGSQNLLTQFRDFVLEHGIPTRAHVRPSTKGPSRQICFGGPIAAQVAHLLYSDCKVALPRKLAKAREFITAYY